MNEQQFGSIEMTGSDIGLPAQKFDKIAISASRELLLLSVIADTNNIKRIRAVLVGGAKAQIIASGIRVSRPGNEHNSQQPGRLLPSSEGYQVYNHKLGFGLAHCLFLSRSAGFMRVMSNDSLWQQLKSPRYTTPVLKEWVPWIEKKLRQLNLLEDAFGYGCKCGVLSAITQQLDEIVCAGLKNYHLTLPESKPIAESA